MWRNCRHLILNNSFQKQVFQNQLRFLNEEAVKKNGLKRLIQTVFGISTLGAGVIVYANYDQDFRSKLENSVPYAKPVLDYCHFNLKTLYFKNSGEKEAKALEPISKTKPATKASEAKVKSKQVKEVDKLLPQVEKLSQDTATAYSEAEAASQDFVSALLRALNVSNPEEEEMAWDQVFNLMEFREHKLQQVKAKEKAFRASITSLEQDLRKNVENYPINYISICREKLTTCQDAVSSAAKKLAAVNKNDALAQFYEDLAARSSLNIQRELEAILPEIKDPNAALTREHMKTVLAHALHKIELVQKKLAIQKATEKHHLIQALMEERRKFDEILAAREEAVKSSFEKETESEFEKRTSMLRENFEQELVLQLRRQTAAHVDHLQEMLDVQQRDLNRKYQDLLAERVIDQEQLFNQEMGTALAKIRNIEESIRVREELDHAVKTTQRLWLAAQSLKSNLQAGQRTNRFPDSRVTLALELGAIQETAGTRDASISAILASIPQTAIDHGVVPQDRLKTRFDKVEKVCRNVALVDSDASLLQYLLSYLRGRLAVPVAHTDPQGLVNPSSWSTLEILAHIRECIASENLEQALRYANLLRGKPREVALGWMTDLKLHLETQQAVEALLSHVTSISVQAFL